MLASTNDMGSDLTCLHRNLCIYEVCGDSTAAFYIFPLDQLCNYIWVKRQSRDKKKSLSFIIIHTSQVCKWRENLPPEITTGNS